MSSSSKSVNELLRSQVDNTEGADQLALEATQLDVLTAVRRGDFSVFGEAVHSSLTDFVTAVFESTAAMDATTFDESSGGSSSVVDGNLVVAGNLGRRFSKSEVIYTPGHEARLGFTAIFPASVASGEVGIGFLTFDLANELALVRDATGMAFVHVRGGVELHRTYSSAFNGTTTGWDPTTGTIYRIRFGYFGYFGYLLEYMPASKDRWTVLHFEPWLGQTVPIFTATSLPAAAWSTAPAGSIASASWRGSTVGEVASPIVGVKNRTTTALGAGGVFMGDWEPNGPFASLELVVVTDQVSAGNGVLIEFSERGDAAATVRTSRQDTFSAADLAVGSKTVIFEPRLRYHRVTYTNGGTAQGSMFLEVRRRTTAVEIPRGSLESDVAAGNTALMTRGALFGLDPVANSRSNITRTPVDATARTGLHVGVMRHDVDTPIKALTSWVAGQASIASTTVAVNVIPSPTSGRKTFAVKGFTSNSKVVFVGPTSGSQPWELAAGETLIVEVDQTTSVWVIGTTATAQSLSFAEVA